MSQAATRGIQRYGLELILAVLAGAVFLGFLGSIDLWGKREQRASAEAIDTVTQGHWLVAQIQGRDRLEKPPLPRWTIALLMELTGRRDEWVVRLPSALSALGMVVLIYLLGKRLGGRGLGIAAGLFLSSLVLFVIELRQAGNDGPLAFFTTLALYAAWRRLHGDNCLPGGEPAALGPPGWTRLMYAALGLGVLTKGPVILLVLALTLSPYLIAAGRLKSGFKALLDGWGLAVFLVLALCWPVPVLLHDPKAAEVWWLEMAQKAGSAGIKHHRARLLLFDWPSLSAPWLLLATTALVLPFARRGRALRPMIWFPWSWAAANLIMFCFWNVAKPNYYLPCLPGLALLLGCEWMQLCRVARGGGPVGLRARWLLQINWALLLAAAVAAPVVVSEAVPGFLTIAVVLACVQVVAVLSSVLVWRRGGEAGALMPLVAGLVLGMVTACGAVAPRFNAVKSHRELAATLDRVLPREARTVMFFHELDEGLWFYLAGRELRPVPGSQPRYNDAVELMEEYRDNRLEWDPRKRQRNEEAILLRWIRQNQHASPYVLLRARDYDLFASDLVGLATPLYREHGLKRNELVLLKVEGGQPVATNPEGSSPARR